MSLTGELIPQTPMRKAVARRMSDSKREVPHFYASTEVEMDAVGAFIAEESDRVGRRITTTSALIHACVAALRSNPRVNSIWTDEGLLQVQQINVGVAIALDDGLIAPALLEADQLDLAGTAAALDDLVERAHTGRLRASELSDATFTLSNLGMFDVSVFSAIVTPPQVAILATGRALARVVPDGSRPRVATVLTPTLSVDHRALDGADAARFLGVLKQTLERPNRALDGPLDE